MRYGLHLSCTCGAVLALALVATSSRSAMAEESGRWFGRAVLVMTSGKVVKVEQQQSREVSVSEWDGVVFNGDGKHFLDKARYQVVNTNDEGRMRSEGYKTFTDADGAKVFARYTQKEETRRETRGEFEFTGGTGKYMGITGRGEYHVVLVGDTVLWDELRGEYKIPGESTSITGSTAPAK